MFAMVGRQSLKFKLLGAFGLCSACLLTVGLISYHGLTRTIEAYDHVVNINLQKTYERSELRMAQKDLTIAIVSLIDGHVSASKLAEEKDALTKAVTLFEDHAKAYEKLPFVEGEQELWNTVKADWATLITLSNKMVDLTQSGTHADELKRDELGGTQYFEARKAIRGHFDSLQELQVSDRKKYVNLALATGERTNTLAIVVVLLGTLFSFALGWTIATFMSRSLLAIASALSNGSQEVAAASGQVSSSSQELSAAASEQAASLEETAASLEEMNSMVNKTSENASHTATTSAESRKKAEQGREVVEQMIRSMTDINESNAHIMTQIDQSNTQIAEIVKVIQEIGSKTKVINDIVFQTKLLSFNASVEAARAGEHGKGFAVVAEEVGNLAQMSGNAAKEISTMLEGSITKVESIVQDTKVKVERLIADGKQKVEAGSSVARQCGEVLAEIVDDVTSVSSMASEISTASREQAQGVQEITKAMGQLDQVTQQNASASEQVASAAEELTAQAESMKAAAGTLNNLIQGHGGQAVTNAPPAGPRGAVPRGDNVVSLKTSAPKGKAKAGTEAVPLAKASGIPSSNHPGFKEV